MNALTKAELNMQSSIENHLDAKTPIIEPVRAFSTTFNNQKALKAQTKPANGGQKSPRTGFAPAKRASTVFNDFEVFNFDVKLSNIMTLPVELVS